MNINLVYLRYFIICIAILYKYQPNYKELK